MPSKTGQQELQTLNVQNLSVKTNLYGNLLIPPFSSGKTGETLLQKAISLESGVHLEEETNGNGLESRQYKTSSTISIDAIHPNNKGIKNGNSFKNIDKSSINRFDSGYGSYDLLSERSFSESNETLLEEDHDHLNDFESINANNQYVISEWQSYNSDAAYSSLDIQSSVDIEIYSPSISHSSPLNSLKIPAPIPETTATTTGQKRNEYIRKVERFGTDMKDTCLFPLALPMDGSDLFKGKTTDWQAILMLADCVLIKWLEASEKHYKPVNRVLGNASKFMTPNPELKTRILQYPNAKLPLRRTNSELDLHKLGFTQRSGLVDVLSNAKTGRLHMDSVSESHVGVRDDIDVFVGNEKGRRRARSSLSVRRKSVHFCVPKGKKDKFDLRVGGNLRSDAKALVQSIRLENPISLAIQITKIQKDLMSALPSDEVMSIVLKKGKHLDKTSHWNKICEFGYELSQLVADIINRESTVETQGKKIAAIIEVGCVLRKLRNWQSLANLINGLQLPRIYSLSSAWSVTKNKYPIHFNDYLKLCQLVRNDSIAILRSREPSIPSLTSFVSLLRVRCLATWDRLEMTPRWTESPNLVKWLERQMLNSFAIEESVVKSGERMAAEVQKKYKKRKQIIGIVEEFHEKSETHLQKCIKELKPEKQSFMPLNDPVYFIEDDHLPLLWTMRSARNIPAVYQSKIIRCFKNSYKLEISRIDDYKMHS